MPESQQQNTPQKSETNGNASPRSDVSTDSKLTPPESQSPLHWLADLAEQKAREEKKGICMKLLYHDHDSGGTTGMLQMTLCWELVLISWKGGGPCKETWNSWIDEQSLVR